MSLGAEQELDKKHGVQVQPPPTSPTIEVSSPTTLTGSGGEKKSIPKLRVLQVLNATVGASMYLSISSATSTMTRDGWTPWMVGMSMFASWGCYMLFVGLGGKLSDSWGRAKTACTGALAGAVGSAIGGFFDNSIAATIGICVNCFGGALFYPGNVGLFSDADGGGDDGKPRQLHEKVSDYNMGWSFGNLSGFFLALVLANFPLRAGWAVACVLIGSPALILFPYRHIPPSPPKAEADRSDHPALKHLILMGRCSLMLYCFLGMSYLSLLENCLNQDGMEHANAHQLAVKSSFAYMCGAFSAFFTLGRWSGWVLKPWRLLACQLGYFTGSLLLLYMATYSQLDPKYFAGVGFLLGVGYASAYTGSIYYSVRIPEGAARAASLHETALGIGCTFGPPLSGALIGLWGVGNVVGLAVFTVIVASLSFLFQIGMIPKASKLGAA